MPIVKKSIRALVGLMIVAALSGCYTRIITKKEYVPILITEALLTPITPTSPPNRVAYVNKDEPDEIKRLKKRVDLLRTNSVQLYGDIDMCNRRLVEIGELNLSISTKVIELNKKEVK